MKKLEIDIEDLLGQGGESISDQIVKKVSVHIANEIGGKVRERINCTVESIVQKKVEKIVDDYFEKGMTETDVFGNIRPSAKRKTLAEIVLSEFDKYLKKEVNSKGQPASYNEGKSTMLVWVVENAAKKLFDERMKPEIEKILVQVKSEIGNRMTEEFQSAIMKIVGLK
jgi:hypothetical protein